MKSYFICLFGLLAMGKVFSQEDSLIQIQTEDIIIKENRLQLVAARLSRNIAVITNKELETIPVVQYSDALQYVPGVDLRQRGPFGVQSDISIRGGTFDQTLVLLNGIKMSDPQTGHHTTYLPIQLLNIKQIEVLKGSASRVYGPNAYSGAVNIQTEIPTRRIVSAQFFGGDFGLWGGQIGLSLPIKKNFNQIISIGHHQSRGYQYNTDFNISNVFYQNELLIGKDKIEMIAGLSSRAFGANGFYASPAFKDQYEEVKTGLLAVSYRYTGGKFILTPRLSWRRNDDNYIFIRSNPLFFNNLHQTDVISAEINGSSVLGAGVIGFGLEHRLELINSTNLGIHQRQNSGMSMEYRLESEQWVISPGCYVNYFSDYGIQWYPGIDIGYKWHPAWLLYVNSGRSFRIPTFTDLFYVGPGNIGNPDLKPEQSWTQEIGIKFGNKWLKAEMNIYYQNATGVIDWTRTSDANPWKPDNLNNLKSIGAEWSAHFYFDKYYSHPLVSKVQISYHRIEASLALPEEIKSRYALEHLNNQFITGITHRVYNKLMHSLTLRWIDRISMEDYIVMDSRLWFPWKGNSIYAEISNLSNTQYRETNLVLMPGRWFRMGISTTIDY
jgi:vitamin B12 transporter